MFGRGYGIVTFPDANLEAAIRYALDTPMGEITAAELDQLTELTAHNRGITDLSGIKYCVNLTYLDLMGNQITDLSPFAALTDLTQLALWRHQISDIAALVDNSGLGGGDTVVWLYSNNLDLSEGSEDLENIRQLEERRVEVFY